MNPRVPTDELTRRTGAAAIRLAECMEHVSMNGVVMTEQAPVEIVRSLYDAVEAGDHARVRACLDAAVRWRQAGTAVPAAGQDLVGADALLERVLESIERSYEGFTEEVERLLDDGRWVVATGTYRGTHRETGRELVAEFCHLWEVDDGRIVAFRQYTDTAAFAAAQS